MDAAFGTVSRFANEAAMGHPIHTIQDLSDAIGGRAPRAVAKVGLELTEFLAGLSQPKPELRSRRRFSMSFDVALLRTHPQSSTWGFKGCCM